MPAYHISDRGEALSVLLYGLGLTPQQIQPQRCHLKHYFLANYRIIFRVGYNCSLLAKVLKWFKLHHLVFAASGHLHMEALTMLIDPVYLATISVAIKLSFASVLPVGR